MKKLKKSVRLSTDVLPERYDISIRTDLQTFVFEGSETIHLALAKPTRSITLHCVDLDILSAAAGDLQASVRFDTKAETMTCTFAQTLPKGTAQLTIAFRGVLNDRMHGFYKSSYAVESQIKYMATTQFEATDARRAFPCFDEPAFKAIFDVALTVSAESTVISNTIPVKTEMQADGYKTVRFAPTPRMSTYLLAFIVGDFEYVQKRSKDGVLVRVFVTPGKKHQAKFALDCAAKTIDFFNAYFDIPYPLPVLDLIAIPDFSAGAMENWGAITYRESALLVDPEQSSTVNKQWVALVIGHEIAHQWFGNLVTMEWWTHLWLNEGFASYIEYLAVDHIFPEWDIWTQFLVSDHGAALTADGLKHTHPIEVEVHHPAEISAVFDAVSYSKGASIIRMLAEYLGEKDFRDGLRYYLKKHSYGNTFTVDLWNALSKISGKPVAKIMRNWTAEEGYPVITISEGTKHFDLRQSRFFSSPISQKRSHDASVWQLPISVQRAGSMRPEQFMMSGRTARIPKTNAWIKLNTNESGFYRTSYPERLRQLLADPIAKKTLKTRDRLGLIRDILAIVETGGIPTHEGLAFAQNYTAETEYVVWAEIASRLAKIHTIIAREPFVQAYESFALRIFETIGQTISWNTVPKDHSGALLKILVLGNRGRYGDKRIIAHAQKLFAGITDKKNPVPADLRGIVYDMVARNGGVGEYTKLVRMYKGAALSEEKNRVGRALGSFKQAAFLKKTLLFSLSKDVRPQDSVRMIAGVMVNPLGLDLAWGFIKDNWKQLFERYAAGRELSYLLAPMELSSDLRHAKEIAAYMKRHPAPGTERTVQQILEHIYSNAAWLARDKKALAHFLK
jgi:puromycin-sensitive aminopeptidase